MFDEDIRDMDFSGGIRANRTFMEEVPAPNPLFVNIYMQYLELLKITPDGVDMSELRRRVHTPDKEGGGHIEESRAAAVRRIPSTVNSNGVPFRTCI